MVAGYAPAALEEIEAAAALSGRAGGVKIVCVVSGGNIDSDALGTILAGETPT
jgi:threonine dehydratase